MGRVKKLGETLPHSEPSLTEHPHHAAFRDDAYWFGDEDWLPVDRSMEFYPELYPRDPDEYEPLDHFYQRQKEPERMLEREIDGFSAVRKTIYAGELEDNGDGCGVFVYDHHGVTFYVVVGFHLNGYRIAVSGWPMLRDHSRALASGAWRKSELATIRAFNNQHFDKDTDDTERTVRR